MVSIRITQVFDVKTNSVNERLTPKGKLIISGIKLKISGDYEGNGVCFIDQESL
ncbi:MAG: DUF4469 domain-containing protein, partial [Spirochaetaceae bacterium]|nr:DUF4469 domain-containing protein [Spirochaetaceae bacterium]